MRHGFKIFLLHLLLNIWGKRGKKYHLFGFRVRPAKQKQSLGLRRVELLGIGEE